MKIRLAVLGSTKGTDMQSIIDAIEKKELNAKIEIVISNKKDAFILERAKKHNLETFFINFKEFPSREESDKKIVEKLKEKKVDLVLLIGYNKILSDFFVEAFENKIVNIHPSLLPSFPGSFNYDVHKEVLASGVKVTGCTLHLVTKNVDGGPIILQKAVPVLEKDSEEDLKNRVQKAEQECFLEFIKKFSEGKFKIEKNKAWLE